MKLTLSQIRSASLYELAEMKSELEYSIGEIDISLSQKATSGDANWRRRATDARKHIQNTLKLVNARYERLHYSDHYFSHGAILAEVRKMMTLEDFMKCVHRGKRNAEVIL